MKDATSTQRRIPALTELVIQAPSAPAKPWFTSVAARMPKMMGTGFLLEACCKDESEKLGFVADLGEGDDTH
jgi:hypothetical protein